MKRLFDIFASLRLTVVCLVLAMVLVFIGTMAQVNEGLYAAQNRYFRSLFIFWNAGSLHIPIFPGGYLVGCVLMLNLVASFLKRLVLNKTTLGLHMIHIGIILLLAGQFVSDLLQVESHMRLGEGEARNYSENSRQFEFAIIDESQKDFDDVAVIPEPLLIPGKTLHLENMPFEIRLREFWPNSRLSRLEGSASNTATAATQGLGRTLAIQAVPSAIQMDERNLPSVTFDVVSPGGTQSFWLASAMLDARQEFQVNGRTYGFEMRPRRYYKPFFLELKEFRHDKYQGTDIPRNFSSRVRIQNPSSGEDREVLIFMNNPLRYGGETFYQSGFDENDPRISILQVVRNPSWLTPYVSCVLVSAGLLYQFVMHLFGFIKERRNA